jgi:hypothetical protein
MQLEQLHARAPCAQRNFSFLLKKKQPSCCSHTVDAEGFSTSRQEHMYALFLRRSTSRAHLPPHCENLGSLWGALGGCPKTAGLKTLIFSLHVKLNCDAMILAKQPHALCCRIGGAALLEHTPPTTVKFLTHCEGALGGCRAACFSLNLNEKQILFAGHVNIAAGQLS